MQNGPVESFNGKLGDEYLNTHWFRSLRQARNIIESWRTDYNEARPHSALGYATPNEFASWIEHHPWFARWRRPDQDDAVNGCDHGTRYLERVFARLDREIGVIPGSLRVVQQNGGFGRSLQVGLTQFRGDDGDAMLVGLELDH